MENDAEREPDASGTEDEQDASRTATAEFPAPAKVNLTRPDIALRRPEDKPPVWYVQFPSPQPTEDAPSTDEDEPPAPKEPRADEAQTQPWPAPPTTEAPSDEEPATEEQQAEPSAPKAEARPSQDEDRAAEAAPQPPKQETSPPEDNAGQSKTQPIQVDRRVAPERPAHPQAEEQAPAAEPQAEAQPPQDDPRTPQEQPARPQAETRPTEDDARASQERPARPQGEARTPSAESPPTPGEPPSAQPPQAETRAPQREQRRPQAQAQPPQAEAQPPQDDARASQERPARPRDETRTPGAEARPTHGEPPSAQPPQTEARPPQADARASQERAVHPQREAGPPQGEARSAQGQQAPARPSQGEARAPQREQQRPQGQAQPPQTEAWSPHGDPRASQERPVRPQGEGRPPHPEARPVHGEPPSGRPGAPGPHAPQQHRSQAEARPPQSDPRASQERPVRPQGEARPPQNDPRASQERPVRPQGEGRPTHSEARPPHGGPAPAQHERHRPQGHGRPGQGEAPAGRPLPGGAWWSEGEGRPGPQVEAWHGQGRPAPAEGWDEAPPAEGGGWPPQGDAQATRVEALPSWDDPRGSGEWAAGAPSEVGWSAHGVRERPGAPGEQQWAQEASVTRAERLPVRESGEYPAARSSGQWGEPWDGSPPEEPEKKRRGRRWLIVLVAAIVLVAGGVTGQLVRPVPEPTIELAIASSHAFPGQAPRLPWPSAGQSAVYVDGLGSMGASGGSAPTPTASVAKVMTAYVYLRDHPLKPGEPGPVLTVSPEAAAQIPMRRKREESLLGVTAYQKLTQRKALEALLIISANDVAHELARWDSGSEQAFVAKMNAAAAELGMTATRYTDPSGYDSGTVSTAADQVKLLKAAMGLPEFAEIVNNRSYVPDGAGLAREGGNFLLGQYGVVGGKTGYTDAAGGNFVFVARKTVQGVETLIVGAVMGQRSPSAAGAVNAAGRLVAAAEGALTAVTLAQKGARVALVDDGLGGTTPLRAAAPVTVVGWPGLTVRVGVEGEPPHRGAAGEQVGTVTAGAGTVPLRLGRALDEPSYLKRLTRLG